MGFWGHQFASNPLLRLFSALPLIKRKFPSLSIEILAIPTRHGYPGDRPHLAALGALSSHFLYPLPRRVGFHLHRGPRPAPH